MRRFFSQNRLKPTAYKILKTLTTLELTRNLTVTVILTQILTVPYLVTCFVCHALSFCLIFVCGSFAFYNCPGVIANIWSCLA